MFSVNRDDNSFETATSLVINGLDVMYIIAGLTAALDISFPKKCRPKRALDARNAALRNGKNELTNKK
jgi:hypothetical protein